MYGMKITESRFDLRGLPHLLEGTTDFAPPIFVHTATYWEGKVGLHTRQTPHLLEGATDFAPPIFVHIPTYWQGKVGLKHTRQT